MEELFEANEKYKAVHPKGGSLLDGFSAFGADELLRIYAEADGRRIYFDYSTEKIDHCIYRFGKRKAK